MEPHLCFLYLAPSSVAHVIGKEMNRSPNVVDSITVVAVTCVVLAIFAKEKHNRFSYYDFADGPREVNTINENSIWLNDFLLFLFGIWILLLFSNVFLLLLYNLRFDLVYSKHQPAVIKTKSTMESWRVSQPDKNMVEGKVAVGVGWGKWLIAVTITWKKIP